MNRWPSIPEHLRLEWKAEQRFLSHEIQRLERRKAELEEMLETFWPEKGA